MSTVQTIQYCILCGFTLAALAIVCRAIIINLDEVYSMKDKISCKNWDSFHPQPLTLNGRCIGVLMPRMTQAQIAATPGIQSWSAPTVETRTDY